MITKRNSLILSALGVAVLLASGQETPPPPPAKAPVPVPATPPPVPPQPPVQAQTAGKAGVRVLPASDEAVARAQLLHASFHGVLEIMHRDFFRKGDNKAIPSESLKDVFTRMGEVWGVEMRWLASDDTIMNVDNKALDDFDNAALKAVAAGEQEKWEVTGGKLRYAGVIPLHNECLKCHVPGRKSLEDRFAALEITMAVKAEPVK